MDTSIDSTTALLTEHLRYAPVNLLDDIINSINDISYRGLESIEKGLGAPDPATLGFKDSPDVQDNIPAQSAEDRKQYEIDNGVHQLETLLESSIDKNFDIMEIFALRNMLAIPDDVKDWVKLRHYEGLEFDLPTDSPTADSIKRQRLKARESQRLNRLLLSESTKNAALIAQLRSLKTNLPPLIKTEIPSTKPPTKSPLAFLSQAGILSDGSASAPLSTTTAFALSQLPALKTLLSQLRPQLTSLSQRPVSDPNIVQSEEDKSARRLRVEYIESQTRRHLETVAGLELGTNGEVIDGEWQGQGRRLNRGEVEDLERIVQMVAGKDEEKMDEM